jgi:hypothetical protein
MAAEPQNEFEKAAGEKPPGLGRELLDLLKHNKKWWLLPIIVALALVGILIALSATGAAPFIYTLF